MVEIRGPATTPTSTGETKLRRDQLVNDYLDAKAAIEKHTIMLKQLAEQITNELGVGGRHEVVPGVGVRVQAPAMSFNAEQAKKVLNAAQFHSICEFKPTADMAKKMLPGMLLDQCKVPGDNPSVREL